MSGEPEQTTSDEQEGLQPISHARILTVMAAVTAVASVVSFFAESALFAFGVLIGGTMSVINYYWLKRSIKTLFELAAEGEKPQFLATRYFLRYLTFAAVLAVVYLTKAVPVVAVLLGLASFALAIVIEGFSRLISGLFNKKEN
jgi:hypothetical protein